MNTKTKTYDYKKIILIISILIFIVSLTQPSYYIDRKDYDAWSNSFLLLIFGWIGAMGGGSGLIWLANPFILISWILSTKNIKTSIIFSIIASILSLSFLLFEMVISSEAPTYSIITEYKLGYWLWTTSMCFFTIGMIFIYAKNKSKD
jgi:hypothetical protein